MSRKKGNETTPNVVVEYVINAPKKVVYQAFLKYIWEENRPWPIGPSSLGSTSDNIGTAYKYNQRKLVLSTITETIIKLKPNNYVCYTVESFLMPANNYVANVKFTNYKGRHNATLVQWSSQWECGCSEAVCSPGTVAMQKGLEKVFTLFLTTIDDIVQKQS